MAYNRLILFTFLISQFACDSFAQSNHEFYPLHLGDKFIYHHEFYVLPEFDGGKSTFIREVIGDTLMPNNKNYFVLQEYYAHHIEVTYSYERIEVNPGFVFKYDEKADSSDDEILIDDLSALEGDSIASFRFGNPAEKGTTLCLGVEEIHQFGNDYQSKIFEINSGIFFENYRLLKNFGLFMRNESADFYLLKDSLSGCIIDGIAYGDTSIVLLNNNDSDDQMHLSLSQNYPNPFNLTTVIKYQVPSSQVVLVKIFDILGREITTLVNEYKAPGEYEVKFDGSELSSGVYFYQLNAGEFGEVKKMIFIK